MEATKTKREETNINLLVTKEEESWWSQDLVRKSSSAGFTRYQRHMLRCIDDELCDRLSDLPRRLRSKISVNRIAEIAKCNISAIYHARRKKEEDDRSSTLKEITQLHATIRNRKSPTGYVYYRYAKIRVAWIKEFYKREAGSPLTQAQVTAIRSLFTAFRPKSKNDIEARDRVTDLTNVSETAVRTTVEDLAKDPPRKVSSEEPRRKPGRPRKEEERRKPGRPRKEEEPRRSPVRKVEIPTPRRKVGRPSKETIKEERWAIAKQRRKELQEVIDYLIQAQQDANNDLKKIDNVIDSVVCSQRIAIFTSLSTADIRDKANEYFEEANKALRKLLDLLYPPLEKEEDKDDSPPRRKPEEEDDSSADEGDDCEETGDDDSGDTDEKKDEESDDGDEEEEDDEEDDGSGKETGSSGKETGSSGEETDDEWDDGEEEDE